MLFELLSQEGFHFPSSTPSETPWKLTTQSNGEHPAQIINCQGQSVDALYAYWPFRQLVAVY